MRLFTERACAAVPGFGLTEDNKAVVALICQRLDGLPLPIELAAARLRVLSAQQILLRLSDRYRPLRFANRGTPPRQQSLRTCIDWSHELCTAPERAVWSRVSVFAGGFELDGAEALCAGEFGPNELLDVLAELVNKSILILEETHGVIRYRMLETVRDYGRDRLRESGVYSTLQRRHRDWFQQLAARADAEWLSPRQAEWTTRLDRELPNLRAAMTYCLADPIHAPVSLHIANALRRFWISRGLLSEGRHWLSRALTSQAEPPTTSQVTALCTDGMLAALQGDSTDPSARMAKARQYAADLADPVLEQLVTRTEGQLALSSGDTALACHSFREGPRRAPSTRRPRYATRDAIRTGTCVWTVRRPSTSDYLLRTNPRHHRTYG
ncbi:ATP-binding protein [Rhodococcus sp. NPDC059968]|uniref:ATP-binding protein n=1 Tax=Rhodococcus sp. NPDC059968 TaxID=3347017 RepID=UPI00366B2378